MGNIETNKRKNQGAGLIDQIACECLLSRARKLDRVLTGIYDAELRPFGLKASQLNLLVLVAKAGPIRRIEIGKRLYLDPSTFTLMIAGMAFSLIATRVYNNTNGSILLMILLHASSNAAVAVGTSVIPTDLSPGLHRFVYSGWIPAITYSVLALLILLFTRGRLSYKGPRSSERQSPVEVELPITPGE